MEKELIEPQNWKDQSAVREFMDQCWSYVQKISYVNKNFSSISSIEVEILARKGKLVSATNGVEQVTCPLLPECAGKRNFKTAVYSA